MRPKGFKSESGTRVRLGTIVHFDRPRRSCPGLPGHVAFLLPDQGKTACANPGNKGTSFKVN